MVNGVVAGGVGRILADLFDPSGFMPRRLCGRWSPELLLLHNLSDALTAISYFTIPAILAYFVRRRLDAPFRPIFRLFAAFIFACGLTHILDIVVFYSPVYRLIGAVKLATGLISVATAITLLRIIPQALALRSIQAMERELEQRRRAEATAAIRTSQLETLVELSRSSLDADKPDRLVEGVASLAARGLDVQLCGIFQALPAGGGLRLGAGVGWRDGLIGSATIPSGIGPLVKFVAREVGADLSPDFPADGRFDVTAPDRDRDAVGGIGVEILGPDGPQGVVVAYMTRTCPFFLVAHAPARPFDDDEVSFLRSVAGLLGSNLGRIEAERALKSQATTDVLTGLHNARYLREAMPALGSHATRSADGRSAIMLDIDRFKSYNDSFGHPAGDEVLCQVGALMRREVRTRDLVARYGGEEFAIVLPGVDVEEARAFAERIRLSIASHPWPLRPVTASLGVATGGPGGPSGMSLLGEADQALYLAKRTGRDRVVHHDDLRARGAEPAGPGSPGGKAEASPAGATILHIDDDDGYRRVLGRHLAPAELAVIDAGSAAEGLRRASESPDLILLDIRLPDGDGLDVCRRLKDDPSTAMTPVLLLSSTLIHSEERARAIEAGASAALAKSADPEELLAIISALLRARRSELELIREKLGMGDRLREQAAELERVCDATIEGWARALELRDHQTEGHSRRVAELTMKVARRMGVGEPELLSMRRGALLHDIGKVGVPDAILGKAGPLDEAEREVMRRHPELGYRLLRPIEFLRGSLDIPRSHHERWDGEGYPDGLSGEAIPLSARIFAAADIHDALSHDRPYRKGWPAGKVKEYMRSLSGTHLEPAVVEAILAVT